MLLGLAVALGGLDAIVELGLGRRWRQSHIPTIGEEICGGFHCRLGPPATDEKTHQHVGEVGWCWPLSALMNTSVVYLHTKIILVAQ